MTVVCNLTQCPFNSIGFCCKKTLVINEQGMCNQIWKNGVQKQDAFSPVFGNNNKDEIKVITLGKENV